MLLMSPVITRLHQVLMDYLTTELVTVDTEATDGFTTVPIPSSSYYDWDCRNISAYPACSARSDSSLPVDVKPDGFGSRVDAIHRVDLMFHATLATLDSGLPQDLQKLLHRYVVGAVRVLAIKKNGLETVADPTRWGSPGITTMTTWAERATYGPEAEQEDGAIVRTATLPIDVRRIEAL